MTLLSRLNRLTLTAVVAVALTWGLTAPAPAAPSPRQQVHGEVLAPSGPRMVGPVSADACGFVTANAEWATRTSPTLFRIPVPANTRGHRFELVPGAPSDLDIEFVIRSGNAGNTYFETRSTAGETGTIPANASEAFVCLVAGAKAEFTYTVA